MPSPLTTHALNTSTGCPARGLEVELYFVDGEKEIFLTKGECNDNGRITDFPFPEGSWKKGVFKICFMTEAYFAQTNTECFYPKCDVTFRVTDPSQHYHVPLLISPFGFSTYRGS